MRLVIADTGPVNYLLLIGHIGILPSLFEKVILPSARESRIGPSQHAAARAQLGWPLSLSNIAFRVEGTV